MNRNSPINPIIPLNTPSAVIEQIFQVVIGEKTIIDDFQTSAEIHFLDNNRPNVLAALASHPNISVRSLLRLVEQCLDKKWTCNVLKSALNNSILANINLQETDLKLISLTFPTEILRQLKNVNGNDCFDIVGNDSVFGYQYHCQLNPKETKVLKNVIGQLLLKETDRRRRRIISKHEAYNTSIARLNDFETDIKSSFLN